MNATEQARALRAMASMGTAYITNTVHCPSCERKISVKFGTIIADPPWEYNHTSSDIRLRGYADKHYDLKGTADIAALDIKSIAADDSVLLLWTTGPMLVSGEAVEVCKGWEFEPITLMYWNKTTKEGKNHLGGVGYWFRGNCEPILVGKRGRSYRWSESGWSPEQCSALFDSPKLAHSQKPDYLHELVESSFWPKPFLELFGRRPREGWEVVGNEMPDNPEDVRDSITRLQRT